MKAKLFGLTVLLIAGVAQGALAQDHDHDQEHGHGHERAGAPNAPPPHRANPPEPGQRPPPQPHPAAPPTWRGAENGRQASAWGAPQPPPHTVDRGFREQDRRDGEHWRPDQRPPDGAYDRRGEAPRRDDRGPADRDHGAHEGPRWAPHAYPPSYRSAERYHGRPWRPPPGYYDRRWRYGEYLPRAWWAPDYLILDWGAFALPVPPPGYAWVRIGYDALLIDEYDGRIVQVVRLVFW